MPEHVANASMKTILATAVVSTTLTVLIVACFPSLFSEALAPSPMQVINTPAPEVVIAGSEEQQVVQAVKKTIGSVVAVQVSREVELPRARAMIDEEPLMFRQQVGGGSGFFVSKDGLLVTNRHVVDDARAEYTVLFENGTQAKARVLDIDPTLDLAIMKVEGVTDAPVLELGDSDAVEVGQTVIAIGNALAEFQNSVTRGIISGKNRRIVAGGVGGAEVIEEAIQTDAAVNLGNSGGPLLDVRGRVIGVNTAVSSRGQSLSFAIPVNAVKRAVESVKKTGKIVRPWLGVRYRMIDEAYAKLERLPVTQGAHVSPGITAQDVSVVPNSPADKAGIKEGDIITKMDDQPLSEEQSLALLLSRREPGDLVRVTVLRGGQERIIEVRLDERTSSTRP